MNQETTKRLLLMIGGSILLGLGIALAHLSGYGNDPLSFSWNGVANLLSIQLGQANLVTTLVLLLLPLIFNRKLIGIGTIVSPLFVSLTVDTVLRVSPTTIDVAAIKVFLFILGLIIFSLGLAVYIYPAMGISAYDAAIQVIREKLNVSIATSRIIGDVFMYLVALLLGVKPALGPVIFIVVTGPMLKYFLDRLQSTQILKKESI